MLLVFGWSFALELLIMNILPAVDGLLSQNASSMYSDETTPATEAERDQHLVGLVFSPVIARSLVGDLVEVTNGAVDVEIFDGLQFNKASLIFDADEHLLRSAQINETEYAERRSHTTSQIEVGGRLWTVAMSTTPAFERLYSHIDRSAA